MSTNDQMDMARAIVATARDQIGNITSDDQDLAAGITAACRDQRSATVNNVASLILVVEHGS